MMTDDLIRRKVVKLKKRTQVERLTIAAALVKEVEAEMKDGKGEDDLLELALEISKSAGTIVRMRLSEIYWRAIYEPKGGRDDNDQ